MSSVGQDDDPVKAVIALRRVRGMIPLAIDPSAKPDDAARIAMQVCRYIHDNKLVLMTTRAVQRSRWGVDEQITPLDTGRPLTPEMVDTRDRRPIGRRIAARYESQCGDCRAPIPRGAACIWRGGVAYHEECA